MKFFKRFFSVKLELSFVSWHRCVSIRIHSLTSSIRIEETELTTS